MAHNGRVRLHAEYKPMLSMLNVVVDLSCCFGSDCETNQEPCFIDIEVSTITYRCSTSRAVFHLEHLQLFPATCRGLRWSSPSEVHLSLQAKHKHNIGPSVSVDNGVIQHLEMEEEARLNNQDIVVSKIQQCQHRCFCAGCGRPIFTPKCVFKRVLPLPTDNWSDFADIWFCHNHSHASPHPSPASPHPSPDASASSQSSSTLPHPSPNVEFEPPKSLAPRKGDCLVSSLYLLVDSSQVCRSTVGITPQTQRLVCMRCGNFVGFVKKKESSQNHDDGSGDGDVYKIYLHAIKFLGSDTGAARNLGNPEQPFGGLPPEQNNCLSEGLVEDFLSQLFQDQSRMYTSFRFIIQSSHEEHSDCLPIVLLVWLLDQNLQVFSSECTVFAKPDETEEAQVPMVRVLKLLYKGSFLSNKETKKSGIQDCVFKMWERDNTVHGINLPYPLCKQLLSLLIASTKQLPFSQRSLNSFHVGYLHCRHMSQITG